MGGDDARGKNGHTGREIQITSPPWRRRFRRSVAERMIRCNNKCHARQGGKHRRLKMLAERRSKTVATISGKEFRRLIEVHGIIGAKTIEALHWHLVQGSSKSEAAWLA